MTSLAFGSLRAPSGRLLVAAAAIGLLAPAASSGRGADGEFEQRSSAHFELHQDVAIDESGGFYGSRRFEQQVLRELENAYDALDRWFELRPPRRLDVVIYDPARFDASYGGLFRFQAAGFYSGVIRVRGATRLTEDLSRVLHHELVHAALDAAAPAYVFPGWVNEGGAEWFERRVRGRRDLSNGERAALAELARSGELLDVGALSAPGFGGMGAREAAIAYLQSYGLVAWLARSGGERKLARFYAELIRSRDLGRALRRVYRLDVRTLEARFREDLV